MSNKSTKKALLTSVLALVLCMSMLIGTTFAWFTDEVTTGNTIIQSGDLEVDLEYWNGTKWVSAAGEKLEFIDLDEDGNTLWEPGCTYQLPKLRVVNKGNLDLKYEIVISGLTGNAKLLEVIDWTFDGEPLVVSYKGTLKAGVEGDAFVIKGHMQETAGNDYEGLTIDNISIAVYATQLNAENDSYGPDYDKDAWHPGMTIHNADDLEAAIANGVDAVLGANVEVDDDVVLTANLDLGGYTLSAGKVTTEGNVVVTNGTLALTDAGRVYAWEDAHIALHNVKIVSDGVSAYAVEGGTVELKNVTFVNTATSNPIQNYGGNMILENVTVAQEGDANTPWYSSAIQVINLIVKNEETGKYEVTAQANATINSGKYVGKKAVMISAPGGNVTINGGTFVGSEYAIQADFAPQNYTYGSDYESVVTINGGDFTGAIKVSKAVKLVITGGTFSHDPSAYVADGYKAVLHDGVYHVVGENVYMNVADMQAAINDGATNVVMGADMTGDLVMKSGVTVEGNGHTLNGSINLNGADNVTLKGITFDAAGAKLGCDGSGKGKQYANIISGDATNKPTKGAFNLVIDGCTFTGTFAKGGTAICLTDQTRSGGGSGNVTIKNCTFDTVNSYYDIYGHYCGNGNNGYGDFVIENNTFKSVRSQGLAVYLGRYASSTPVVVTGNSFAVDVLENAVYVQDHSSYGVSVNASNNTFGG